MMEQNNRKRSPSGSLRAPRFPIRMSLHYRTPDQGEWLEGETENISRSGVLFHTSSPLDVSTPLEMTFALPVEVGGQSGALVLCRGQVVGIVLRPSSDAPPCVAAKFLEYRIVRSPEELPH
jgi:hypothetical protein